MTAELYIALIAASAAILGTIAGGIISFFTATHLREREWRQSQIDRSIAIREELYADFIAECGQLLLSAVDQKTEKSTTFVQLYTLLGKIRMLSCQDVIESAEKLGKHALMAHQKSDDVTEEERQAMGDDRRSFIEVARRELDSLGKHPNQSVQTRPTSRHA